MAVGCVAMGDSVQGRPQPEARNGGGDYGDSDCCEAASDSRTGCDDAACETLVCDADPYCCNVQWDGLCSNAAVDECSVCTGGGSSGGYDTGTDGGADDDDDDDDDAGPPPTGDEGEVCCVERCCTDPWGYPATCSAQDIEPFPSIDPSAFNCPVHTVPYTPCAQGDPNFDCDDFAYACKMWGDVNGIHVCQITATGTYAADGKPFSHAFNIVEFDYPSTVNTKYCFIEPQSNNVPACWIQPVGEPDPPSFAIAAAETYYGLSAGTLTVKNIWCEALHSTTAGEACFTTDPAMCQLFENHSGLCADTFEAPPPPPPPPETQYCTSINGNNESCYWDCPIDTVCSDTCYVCEEAPDEPPPPPPPPVPPYTNPVNCHDVNNDGFVSPLDALLIISYLNSGGSTQPSGGGPPYYDTSGDGFITPIDVLKVMTLLNGGSSEC